MASLNSATGILAGYTGGQDMAAAGAAAAGSLVSGLFATGLASQANKNAKKAARRAFERSVKAYKHRYQWTMEDMRKAGLNPILAYGQGAGSAPTAQQAQTFLADASSLGRGAEAGIKAALADPQKRQIEAATQASVSSAKAAEAAASKTATETIGVQQRNELDRLTLEAIKRNKGFREAWVARQVYGTGMNPSSAKAIYHQVAPAAKEATGGLIKGISDWLRTYGDPYQ